MHYDTLLNAFHLRQNETLLLRAQDFFNLKYIFSPQRWNRTTPTLIGYGFEGLTPDHQRSLSQTKVVQ